jgi:hypothetical protein
MIYAHQLTEETQKLANMIEEAAHYAKDKISTEVLKNLSDKLYDNMHEVFNEWFSYNLRDNFMLRVAYEVNHILRELLNGNLEVIKNINLISDYTFDNLHEIRLGIWKAAGQDIEGSIVREQQKQIDELKKRVENAERRWL